MVQLFVVFDVFGSNGEFVCTIFANFASFQFLSIFEMAKFANFHEFQGFTTFWIQKSRFDIWEVLELLAVSTLFVTVENPLFELFKNLVLFLVFHLFL